ncbi:MAG: hypothetical protein ABIK42_05585 [candidate division WOR-3 bacterium]
MITLEINLFLFGSITATFNAVMPDFIFGQFPILKSDNEFAVVNCLNRIFLIKDKEALFCRLIGTKFGLCLNNPEYSANVLDSEGVVTEKFAGLDIILVRVCPVEFYLFTIIRDGVAVPSDGIAIMGSKVALLIIPGEEVVKVVEDLKFYLINRLCLILLCLYRKEFPADRCVLEFLFKFACGCKRIISQGLNSLLFCLLKPLIYVCQPVRFMPGKGRFNFIFKVFFNESGYPVPFVIQNPVNAKIKIRCLKLKKFFQ